jgi:hypothetical protein
MISTAFNLDAFIRDDAAFARVVPASDLFTLLSRQAVVPPSCVALVWGEAAQPWFVAGGRQIEAAGAREVLFVKAMPIPLEYEVSPLPSRDGFDFSASLRIAVQVVPDRSSFASRFSAAAIGPKPATCERIWMRRFAGHCRCSPSNTRQPYSCRRRVGMPLTRCWPSNFRSSAFHPG